VRVLESGVKRFQRLRTECVLRYWSSDIGTLLVHTRSDIRRETSIMINCPHLDYINIGQALYSKCLNIKCGVVWYFIIEQGET
jgi:hypothetical protein